MSRLLYLSILAAMSACSAIPTEASHKTQATMAGLAEEVSCTRHLNRLVALQLEGWSCEKAKEQAALENPTCNLSFHCKVGDAGAEGGAE